MTDSTSRAAHVDQLLERAATALNRGDVRIAHELAAEVLAADAANRDAVALLDVEDPSDGELRPLSLLFCDLVPRWVDELGRCYECAQRERLAE